MNFNLLTWIYCLDFSDIILLTAAATSAFRLLERRFRRSGWWSRAVWLLLVAAAGAVVYTTLISREPTGPTPYTLVPLHSYREVLAGGSVELLRSNFMNVLLFYPVGLFAGAALPGARPRWQRVAVVLAVCTAASIAIECVQYRFCLGRVEMDDVIHNTVGSLLGAVIGSIPDTGKTEN